jgi:hypothetical protein
MEGRISTFMPTVSRILAASQEVIERTGPWGGARPESGFALARRSYETVAEIST